MPNISDIAKFESDLLKIKEDISRKILRMFEWWGVQTCHPAIKSL